MKLFEFSKTRKKRNLSKPPPLVVELNFVSRMWSNLSRQCFVWVCACFVVFMLSFALFQMHYGHFVQCLFSVVNFYFKKIIF
jgi:hypothetical protein